MSCVIFYAGFKIIIAPIFLEKFHEGLVLLEEELSFKASVQLIKKWTKTNAAHFYSLVEVKLQKQSFPKMQLDSILH